MKYEKYNVIINSEDKELACYYLFEAGAEGIEIFDSNEDNIVEIGEDSYDYISENALISIKQKKLIEEYGKKCFLTFFFEEKNGFDAFKKLVNNSFSFKHASMIVDSESWENEWKKFYVPFKVKNMWIIPSWENSNFAEKENSIVIDPGIAFGTGQHETTTMILSKMQEFDFKNKSVIDIGCGSGILGICSLKLQAKNCLFIDIEERAVSIAIENTKSSLCFEKSTFKKDYFNFDGNKYNYILANLTASIIKTIIDDIVLSIHSDGVVFVSGIIDGKETETIELFLSRGFLKLHDEKINCWNSFVFKFCK